MIQIAICDDNAEILGKLKEYTTHIFKRMNIDMEMTAYSDGNKLLEVMRREKDSFDILLLDIDMPGISGFEIAKTLREIAYKIIIIFISSYENYVYESFQYSPFRYIRKVRIKEELPLALKAACSLYEEDRERYVVVKDDDREYRIAHSEICYFNIEDRKLNIYLEDGRIYSVWKTVKEFLDDLQDDAFVKIHSGCAVNMKYIREYSKDEIILDSGKKLLGSRDGMKLLKAQFARYWSKRV